ncbi:hypothetical protein Ga0466249_002274 [Sporomusaceae bacterium BoRhaA]|uniref:hypothetical protein n=1 Tax=Pelorhabdus rhamnosifermentans TaxID=2772457 RepID=UPI001C05FD3A|nr:hypothetical protein [Pelorhabdus rhamnosifermentans]MBU2701160.1 hypothetical protein [Pelorhabdus rhamnosifermentans]
MTDKPLSNDTIHVFHKFDPRTLTCRCGMTYEQYLNMNLGRTDRLIKSLPQNGESPIKKVFSVLKQMVSR